MNPSLDLTPQKVLNLQFLKSLVDLRINFNNCSVVNMFKGLKISGAQIETLKLMKGAFDRYSMNNLFDITSIKTLELKNCLGFRNIDFLEATKLENLENLILKLSPPHVQLYVIRNILRQTQYLNRLIITTSTTELEDNYILIAEEAKRRNKKLYIEINTVNEGENSEYRMNISGQESQIESYFYPIF